MDERTLRVLEFAKVRDRLAAQTVTAIGRETATALMPSPDPDMVRRWQQGTREAISLLADGDVPLRGTSDIRDALQRCQIGSALEPRELLAMRDTLATIRQCKGYIDARRDRVEQLRELADQMAVFSDLEEAIRRTVADDGTIPDSASPDLARIRRERRTTEARIREKLDDLLRGSSARMLQDALVTTRGDRFVVPVKQEFKGQFPGVLHDQSSSGATAFMEPLAVVPLGNRMRELDIEERDEITRLLRALSGRIGVKAEAIGWAYEAVGHVDFAVAKARLADLMHASPPEIETTGSLRFMHARHPLLTGDVVPIDIWLGEEFTTLVLTGPNTGGKTVTLKTVGLLTLMAQAGLFLPADPGSHAAVFSQVFADIGDEQSIEQSLSTFSSHMGAIVKILKQLDDEISRGSPSPPLGGEGRVRGVTALVLLDEIGAGTDPAEGVALARALIEHLHALGARTVVTTHYSELKALAYDHPGIQNASVEFDTLTLAPTYRLLIGIPGRSNALTIATRLGLKPEVVEKAQSYLGAEVAAIDRILSDIESDRRAYEFELAEAARMRREAEDLRGKYDQEAQRLKEQRAKILGRLREEADALLVRTRREVEAILESLKAKPSAQNVADARSRLRQIAEDLEGDIETAPQAPDLSEPLQHVEPGQRVLIVPLNRDGVVAGPPDSHGEVEVESGTLRVRVHVSALRAAPAEAERLPTEGPGRHVPTYEVFNAPHSVPLSIEIRGETTDEARPKLEQYIDDAYVAGYDRVTIVHGKGTGVLRSMVHNFLSSHPQVKHFRLGGRGEGDTGVTIVEFKK
jgi:DNA mismatch repair protein MutS2